MKKIITIVICLIMGISIIGCKTNDKEISDNQSSSLEEKKEEELTEEDKFMRKIASEFKLVDSLSNGKYIYQALAENTLPDDIDSFSLEMDLIDKYGVKVDESWARIYNWKSGEKAIVEFETDRQIESCNIKDGDVFEQSPYQIVEKVKNVELKSTGTSSYGENTYQVSIKNTTPHDFNRLVTIHINLFDKDGVMVYSDWKYANNWKSGWIVNAKFATSKQFESARIEYQYYEDDY